MLGPDISIVFNSANSIPRKLAIGNSTGYFTRYIEIVREICNSTARVK